MPIMRSIIERLEKEKPFKGLTIGICLHVEAKTGVWMEALTKGGARVVILGGFAGYPDLSLELILGYLFSPLAVIIGIPFEEALSVATFIGQKLVLNEFVAYVNFTDFLTSNELSERSTAIITFALCGFANFSAAAMLLGGLGAMAKERRSEISQLALYAILAGTLSNLMSATIAGFFLSF